MFKKLLIAGLLVSASASAWAQGQLGANQITGNPTASAAPWQPSNIGSFLTQGTGVTISGTPKATIALTNQITAGGPTGSATQTPVLTYNAQGQLTVVSLATIAPPFSAVTGSLACSQHPALTGFVTSPAGSCVTSLGATVTIGQGGTGQVTQTLGFNALAPTPTRAGDVIYWNGSNYVTLAGNNSGTQVFTENASGVPSWTAPGTGTVTSLTPGGGLVSSTTANCSQTAITTSGTLSAAECVNAQVGTSYAIADTDRAKLVTASNAAAQAYTIAQAGAASNFFAGWFTEIANLSSAAAAVVTVTPTTSTICGGSTLKLYPGERVKLVSDGTNYTCSFLVATQGPWRLLNTLTASNSATLTDTTSISAAFTEYEIVLEQILPATNNVVLRFQVQVSGTFQGVSYVASNNNANGSANGSTSDTGGVIIGSLNLIPNVAPGVNGRYLLSNPAQTLTCKMIFGEYTFLTSSAVSTGTSAGCYNGGSAAITGIQLLTSSGNLTSGVMKIYGRVN